MSENDTQCIAKEDTLPQLSAEFEIAARDLSKGFGLDLYALKDAYSDKQDSLTYLNNTVEDAQSSRRKNILWGVVSLFVFFPVVAWPGYHLWRNTQRIDTVKDTIQDEIMRSKSNNSAPNPS